MALKLRKRSLFPAVVAANSPLTLTKNGASYTFDLSITALRSSLDPYYGANTVSELNLTGATSGTTRVIASATASGTVTVPAATDTLVGKATTDTLTNKTFDTAGTGNSLKINGLAASDNTGTGKVVRDTSPTLTTPALGTPSAVVLTNGTGLPVSTGLSGLGTGVATFLATPSSANLRSALTDETGSGAAVFATGPTITNIVGTNTNDNAAAGAIGEILSATRGVGTAVSLATGTAANVLTLSLTAGDWDVSGNVVFYAGAGMVSTEYHVCIDAASATINSDESAHAFHTTFTTGQSAIIPSGMKRFSLAGTTTVYLNCTQTFSGGTLSAGGNFRARRVR